MCSAHEGTDPISNPESSGCLASVWSPCDQPLAKEPKDSGYEIEGSTLNRKCGLFKTKDFSAHYVLAKTPQTNSSHEKPTTTLIRTGLWIL